MCLYSWEYTINHYENEDEIEKWLYTTKTDLCFDMGTNIVNIRSVSVWWCFYITPNTQATLEAQFIKKLSNTEAELKKRVAYKKSVYMI